jgi:protein-tyrosine-phosphatase
VTPPPQIVEPFRVLMVCSANQCRSPLAEHLLRHSLRPLGLDWIIESAGIRAHSGRSMHRLTARTLEDRGLSVGDWSTRRLTAGMVDEADLILTAESAHRSAVVTLAPHALPRTFLLLQFARLASAADPVNSLEDRRRGEQLVEHALGVRNTLQAVPPSHDDIDDPVGRRASKFRRCADTVQLALEAILAPLAGDRGPARH